MQSLNIMMTLFNDDYILKTYVESERREATEAAEATAKAATKKSAWKLFQKGNTFEDIADVLDVSLEEVEQWLEDFES